MSFSNEKIRAALELLEQGIRDEVLLDVKASLEGGGAGRFSSYLYMPIKVAAGRQLVVRLKFEDEEVAVLDIREELLAILGDDPLHYAEQIKAAAQELRSLADEVLALLPVEQPNAQRRTVKLTADQAGQFDSALRAAVVAQADEDAE